MFFAHHSMTGRVHWTTFHTPDMSLMAQRYERMMAPYVDSTSVICSAALKGRPATRHLVQFSGVPTPYNAGAHRIGFFRWKPYVILEALHGVSYGDVVYYRDCNIRKYPAMVEGVHETRATIEHVLHGDIFTPGERRGVLAKHHVKSEVFRALDADTPHFHDRALINASLIIVRKTQETVLFIKEWLRLCCVDELIVPTPSVEHPEFRWHTMDQAILNVLIRVYQHNGELFAEDYPRYTFGDERVFTRDALVATEDRG